MKKIASLLLNKTCLTIIGLIFLVLTIWIGGAIAGIQENTRLYTIIGVLVFALGIFITKKILASKLASNIENQLKQQAEAQMVSARPDQRDTIEGLKSQLETAIGALKKSQLSKSKWGNAALYELPWYIIIGPPSAGKSTLLHSSSLYFPYMSAQGKGIQGVGGTRNCDWWFSNEAVFLDTAGRYAIEDRDKGEWLGFLDLLRKYRAKKPINGSIIGISIAELLEMTEDEVESTAQKLRARIDELTLKLKVKFPIYLIFTKCDLLNGFVDFFGDISKSQRDQIWGFSFSSKKLQSKNMKDVFKEELEKLFGTLDSMRLTKLSSVINQKSRNQVLLFPLQFSAAAERLTHFMDLLIQPNPYQESPIFRGFYFTSGTQEGNPIDQVISKIGNTLNLPESINEPYSDEIQKKSYFIKELLTKVVFPDQNMAHLISSAKYSQAIMRYTSLIVPIIASLGLLFAFSFSFLNNKSMLNRIRKQIIQLSTINWSDNNKFHTNLPVLDRLRSELEILSGYKKNGIPLSLRMGLYKGENVNTHARTLYFSAAKKIFIDPVAYKLVRDMRKMSEGMSDSNLYEWTNYYNTLKAYLMMARPSMAEADFLKDILKERWETHTEKKVYEKSDTPMTVKKGLKQMEFYLSEILQPDAPKIVPDNDTIDSAKQKLNSMPVTFRLYADLKTKGKNLKPFKLNDILKDEERIIFSSKAIVQGMYKKTSWESTVRSFILNAWDQSTKEDWVLRTGKNDTVPDNSALEEKEKEKLASALKEMYIKDYVKKWRKFLKGVNIVPFAGIEEAVLRLDILSDTQRSPILNILSELITNIELEKHRSADETQGSQGIVEKTKQTLKGLAHTVQTSGEIKINPLESEYKNILKFSGAGKQQVDEKLPIQQYLKSLRMVYEKLSDIQDNSEPDLAALTFARKVLSGERSEINKGIKITDSLMRNFSSSFSSEIKELLIQPFDHAWQVILNAATLRLNRRWKSAVYSSFKNSLQGKYPFAKISSEDDVSLVDLGTFLNPNEGIFWDFHNNNLKPFLNSSGKVVSSKKWRNRGIVFSNSFISFYKGVKTISEAIYGKKTQYPRINFSIHPYVNPSVAEIFMEIDGNGYTFLNSPDEWHKFTWPQTDQVQGAEISIKLWKQGWDREKLVKLSSEGVWGFFKLLEKANIKQQSNRNFKLTWNFKMEGYSSTPITFLLKAESYKNPFIKGTFSSLSCPEKLG